MVDTLLHLLPKAHLSCGLSKHRGQSRWILNIVKALDMAAISALVCSTLATYLRAALVTRSLFAATACAIGTFSFS